MIRLSKKGEYALRALVEIAQAAPEGQLVSIATIAKRTRIPEKFLEQILLIFKNGGVLKSKRGMVGGYGLNRPPSSISLQEIYRLTEGPLASLPCLDPENKGDCSCPDRDLCPIRISLKTLHEALLEPLKHQTLATLLSEIQQCKSKKMSSGQYDI